MITNGQRRRGIELVEDRFVTGYPRIARGLQFVQQAIVEFPHGRGESGIFGEVLQLMGIVAQIIEFAVGRLPKASS